MYKTIEFVFFVVEHPKKNSAGCAMIFCNEMSPRVEEQFCKNICFLGIDTNYCSDLYTVHVFDSTQSSDSCFGYFRNHGSFLGLQAPCHFVRHSPSFMAAILSSISFWIWWRHQLSSQRVLCRPRATLTAISYFHFVHFLSCSTFMCFLFVLM